ncbi:MAG: DUF354 domain-containing protein [Flavobacteriaceae bacterium]|nr:DUF354 domain-containing protein [Flavobacteriaceae bacterium]
MNILFDINHPVDVNFFKNAILILRKKGHNIYIIFRGRGKLEKILRYELAEFPITMLGEHAKGFLNKITSQLHRDYKIIPFIKRNNIDLVACFGPTAAISTWYCRKPYLAFDDDFEYKIPFYHANWFSTKHIYPDMIEYSNSKTVKYHGFKELAYLHPKYLKVSDKILDSYSIEPNEYVFIREISNVSLNYQDSNSTLDQIIETIRKRGLTILLSLENKELHQFYTDKGCVVLKEPVSDIYSLMYYSLFAISSGYTWARETALLGVPTIYTGGRAMVVNSALVKAGAMFEVDSVDEIKKLVSQLTIDTKKEIRNNILNLVENKWDDTTEVILNQIEFFLKQPIK